MISERNHVAEEKIAISIFDRLIDAELLPDRPMFIKIQSMQVWMRLGLLIMFSIFTLFHGGFSDALMPLIVASGTAHLLLNLLSFSWVRRTPYSWMRIAMMPIFDFYLIVLVMLGNGGQMSVVYFLLLSPVIGNGLRYGSRMLIYCQLLGLLAMAAISLLTIYMLKQPIDWLGLTVQMFAILYISSYTYGIIRRTEGSVHQKQAAEVSASRLIADAPHPAFTFDLQSGLAPIIYANPAMATLITAQPGSLAGTPIDQLVIPEDRQALRQAVAQQHDDPSREQCYVRIPASNGVPVQVRCEICRTLQEGKQLGLCYLTDISESERLQGELAEAQKQSQAAALASGVAHDFRNLLSAIIGHAELISLEHDDPQLQKDVRHIIAAGNRGSDLVEQLLQLGRSNRSDFKVLNISRAVKNMVHLARVQLPPDIELSIKAARNLPKVRANIAQIEQVILNLVSNAVQAMPNQTGKISIKLSRVGTDADTAGLSIALRDNGSGIEPESIPAIFKPFWSTRKDDGGTGLGLAMVQRIIRWHHGHIDVDSVPGDGTVFNIFLPEYIEEKHADNHSEKSLNVQTRSDCEGVRPLDILLVEDQPDVMDIHRIFLSRMGHRVQTANNGQSAYNLWKNSSDTFDMVLTDYMMPVMDGIALTKAIRTQDSDLPVTILTAFSEDGILSELKDQNTHIMSKPLSYHQLHAHMSSLQDNSVFGPST